MYDEAGAGRWRWISAIVVADGFINLFVLQTSH